MWVRQAARSLIRPIPTLAMGAVITAWNVGWLAIWAWRMATRDA